jgi:hypothetical protein
MYTVWANLVLIILALIVGSFIWFVFFIFGKAIIEDFLGGIIKKIKKKKEKEEDFYLY